MTDHAKQAAERISRKCSRWTHRADDAKRIPDVLFDFAPEIIQQAIDAATTELQADLEAVNAMLRSFGYGQGEIDGDIAGCLEKIAEQATKWREHEATMQLALEEYRAGHSQTTEEITGGKDE